MGYPLRFVEYYTSRRISTSWIIAGDDSWFCPFAYPGKLPWWTRSEPRWRPPWRPPWPPSPLECPPNTKKVYHVRNCSPILNGMPPAKEYGLLYTGLYIFSIPAGNHGYLWPLRSVNGGMDRSNRIITVTNGPFCNGSWHHKIDHSGNSTGSPMMEQNFDNKNNSENFILRA